MKKVLVIICFALIYNFSSYALKIHCYNGSMMVPQGAGIHGWYITGKMTSWNGEDLYCFGNEGICAKWTIVRSDENLVEIDGSSFIFRTVETINEKE